jgi:glycosyltransferase involved in cell wall biosynthesis
MSPRDRTAEPQSRRSEGAPRVSIIVPFLDTPPRFLEEAVQSVLSQTFHDWELLLVNDGSGPETSAAAERLAAADTRRIHLLQRPRGENRGAAASRSLGFEHARGDLVACLDSDDVWMPEKLEEQVHLMDSYPQVDMLFGRSVYWYSWNPEAEAEDYLNSLRVPDRTEMAPGEFLLRILRYQVVVPCPSAVILRASVVRSAGGFGEFPSIYEDQWLYARVSQRGVVMACEEVWAHYRIHPASVVGRTDRRQRRMARAEFLDLIRDQLLRDGRPDPGLRRTVRAERWAASVPWGPQVTRLIRQLPQRIVR